MVMRFENTMTGEAQNSRPKLSVFMITYNHEKFIAHALDSVLMQEVNFEYEIVIGDDLSTDRTREILLRYQQKYPELIKLIFHETRMGVGGNAYAVLDACKGDYIALLEGDDYWTSTSKLKQQVAFLEAHSEYTLCFQPVEVYSEEKQQIVDIQGSVSHRVQTWTLHDVLSDTIPQFPRTCSIVFRASAFELPAWFPEIINGDFVIVALCATNGDIANLGNCMAVYRLHDHGVWSAGGVLFKLSQAANTREHINNHFDYRYASCFHLNSEYAILAQMYSKAGDHSVALLYLRKALFSKHSNPAPWNLLVKTILLVLFPRVHGLLKTLTRFLLRINANAEKAMKITPFKKS